MLRREKGIETGDKIKRCKTYQKKKKSLTNLTESILKMEIQVKCFPWKQKELIISLTPKQGD